MVVKSIDATVVASPEPVWVMADEEQVGRALYSLFGHAEKYARENGQLLFTVAVDAGVGLVTVRDPNRVLPEQMVSRAFELVEIGRDGRAALRGTDLGLVVARRVAEALSLIHIFCEIFVICGRSAICPAKPSPPAASSTSTSRPSTPTPSSSFALSLIHI